MNLTSKPLALIIFIVLFGGILLSAGMGWWETESTKVAATYTEGDFAGQANPADIRGSYTFGDVEKNFGIPAASLAQAFGVGADDPAAYPVKDLESIYAESELEVGTASVRLFVAFYNGLPFDLSGDIYLPESAAALLRERNLTAERSAYLEAHLAPSAAGADSPQPEPASAAESTPEAEHAPAAETERTIKGKTTFGEILLWGVSRETIEAALGVAMPESTALTVKDFCSANGLSFETVKTALQAQVDQLP